MSDSFDKKHKPDSSKEINRRQMLTIAGTSVLGVALGACGGGGGKNSDPIPTPTPTPTSPPESRTIQVERIGNISPTLISSDGKGVVGYKIVDGLGASPVKYWSSATGIYDFGNFQGDSIEVTGISSNGRVIIGNITTFDANNSRSLSEAFRWTIETGFVRLGKLREENTNIQANALSDDGKVIVGESSSSGKGEAFRWTAETGMVSLGKLRAGARYTVAKSISGDGRIIVGNSGNEAFRWVAETGMVSLGYLYLSDSYSSADKISKDGKIIIGNNFELTFKWIENVGMSRLGNVDIVNFYPSMVSSDGNIIIGNSNTYTDVFINSKALRQTLDGNIVDLGHLNQGDQYSAVTSSSGDGNVILGTNTAVFDLRKTTIFESFIWTRTRKMRRLLEALQKMGADMNGWEWIHQAVISADGKTIIGNGMYNGTRESFRAYSINGFDELSA
jgi:probable HAF family extracellular repeat protein